MRSALLIARKDIVQRMRDRSVFIYAILAPLGLAFVFSFVFGPLERAEFRATYAVVNEDGGPVAEAFLGMLDSLEKEGLADIVAVDSAEEARQQVVRGSDELFAEEGPSADAAFVLPADLSERMTEGRPATITVIGSAGAPMQSQVAYSAAQGFAAEVDAVGIAIQTTLALEGGAPDPAIVSMLADEIAAIPPPVTLEDVTATTRQLRQTTHLAAGMSVFFLFFTVSFGVSGLLGERKEGTLGRLLAAPIDPRSIIVGKALTSFALGIASMAVLVVATTLLLGAQWGNPVGVALLVIAVVFAATGILGMVAAVARTQAQAENFLSIFSLVLAFLGGTFFPVAQAGGVLAALSLATPHAWFLRGLGDLQSGEIAAAYPAVAALMLFGLVTGGIAWPFMRRAVER